MGRPLAATHWRRPGPDARRLSPDRDLCSGCLHAPTRSAAPASVADPAPDAELWRCIPVPGPVVTEGRNARPVGACRALRATGGGGRSKAAPTLRNAAKLERLLGRLPAPGGETGDSGISRGRRDPGAAGQSSSGPQGAHSARVSRRLGWTDQEVNGIPARSAAPSAHSSMPSSDPSGGGDAASSHHHRSHPAASPPWADPTSP